MWGIIGAVQGGCGAGGDTPLARESRRAAGSCFLTQPCEGGTQIVLRGSCSAAASGSGSIRLLAQLGVWLVALVAIITTALLLITRTSWEDAMMGPISSRLRLGVSLSPSAAAAAAFSSGGPCFDAVVFTGSSVLAAQGRALAAARGDDPAAAGPATAAQVTEAADGKYPGGAVNAAGVRSHAATWAMPSSAGPEPVSWPAIAAVAAVAMLTAGPGLAFGALRLASPAPAGRMGRRSRRSRTVLLASMASTLVVALTAVPATLAPVAALAERSGQSQWSGTAGSGLAPNWAVLRACGGLAAESGAASSVGLGGTVAATAFWSARFNGTAATWIDVESGMGRAATWVEPALAALFTESVVVLPLVAAAVSPWRSPAALLLFVASVPLMPLILVGTVALGVPMVAFAAVCAVCPCVDADIGEDDDDDDDDDDGGRRGFKCRTGALAVPACVALLYLLLALPCAAWTKARGGLLRAAWEQVMPAFVLVSLCLVCVALLAVAWQAGWVGGGGGGSSGGSVGVGDGVSGGADADADREAEEEGKAEAEGKEEAADAKEAEGKEEAADAMEAADAKEEAEGKEEAAYAKEAADAKEEAADAKEEAADAKEEAADAKEEAADAQEEAADAKEEAAAGNRGDEMDLEDAEDEDERTEADAEAEQAKEEEGRVERREPEAVAEEAQGQEAEEDIKVASWG